MRRACTAITTLAARRAVAPRLAAPVAVAVTAAVTPVAVAQAAFQGSAFRPGDWNCPSCRIHNFRSRTTCFACNCPKPEGAGGDSAGGAGGGGGGGGAGGGAASFDFKPGDWTCSCGQHNFRRRTQCMACNKPRPDSGI